MRKLILNFVLVGLVFFGSMGNINAQIFDHADDEESKVLGTEREVFSNDAAFEKKGRISKRGDGAVGFDSGLTYGGSAPIDGGLGIFVGGLLGYGIKKMKKRRQRSNV